jgi:hypothetical protein
MAQNTTNEGHRMGGRSWRRDVPCEWLRHRVVHAHCGLRGDAESASAEAPAGLGPMSGQVMLDIWQNKHEKVGPSAGGLTGKAQYRLEGQESRVAVFLYLAAAT